MARPNKEDLRRRRIAKAVSKLKPATVQKLESAFAIDATIEEACFYANISPATYHNWINKNPDLLERFAALRNTPILKARQAIVNSLSDPGHAFRYMGSKRPHEFGSRAYIQTEQKIEVRADDNNAMRRLVEEYEEKLREEIARGVGARSVLH